MLLNKNFISDGLLLV